MSDDAAQADMNKPTNAAPEPPTSKERKVGHTTIMSVLECPWSDEPMSWNARDRVKWLLSSRFRQDLTARRAREAEVRRLRLNIDARMFVREIYHQQLYENDELRLKPEQFANAVRGQLDEALSHAPTEIDPQVARALLEHALAERARWIIDASFTADQPQHRMSSDPPSIDRYEFKIQTDDQPGLGNVTYRVCTRCQQGVLDNITVAAEIGCGGVGRRALVCRNLTRFT